MIRSFCGNSDRKRNKITTWDILWVMRRFIGEWLAYLAGRAAFDSIAGTELQADDSCKVRITEFLCRAISRKGKILALVVFKQMIHCKNQWDALPKGHLL